ncbi:hypothetical protein [Microbacterium sp. CPCC 204701]|uniref:hypothetical protein n=1 Tax=Microbacterium sp. CPCC 204701 TaxID=2493084 RepID=UPI000FDAD2D1|nr:hypothetical protein [Microbacterium sp. CPCC 204701]
MPGLRSLRPPLFAGVLWGLFAWVLLANQFPSPDEATGWIAQAYSVLDAVGVAGIAVVVGVGAFLIGVAALALTDPIANLVGRFGKKVGEVRDWQFWVRSRRKQLELQRRDATSAIEKIDSGAGGPRSNRAFEEQKLKATEASHVYFSGFLGRLRRIYTPQSKAAVAAVGKRRSTELTAEGAVIQRITSEAFDGAVLKDGMSRSQDPFFRGASASPDTVAALHSELGSDALDSLRVLDEKLFLELDRERSERLVRLAVSFPIIAFGILLGVLFNPAIGVVVGLAGLILLFRYSADQSEERGRILNLLVLRGAATTPAMRSAVLQGELRYRELKAEYDEEREDERRKAEEAEIASNGASRAPTEPQVSTARSVRGD